MSILNWENFLMFLSGVVVPILVVLINKKLEAKKLISTDKLIQELQMPQRILIQFHLLRIITQD